MEEIFVNATYELTDAETGSVAQYDVVGLAELDGRRYAALVPTGQEVEEYVILRIEETENETEFCGIEDDDEWERAAVYFDNEIFRVVDHDEN